MLNSCLRCLRLSVILSVVSLTSIMATAQTATPQPEADRVILVISSQDGDPKLYTIDPETRDRELFLDLTAYGRLKFAALSPDGTKLAFVVFEEAEWLNTLYILDMQTGKATKIRASMEDIEDLSWSADNLQLFYLANGVMGDFSDIYRYDIVTQTEQELNWNVWTADSQTIKRMEQSPNGQKFLFTLLKDPPDAVTSFVVINADGSNAESLPITRNSFSPTAWNPQSSAIYYACYSGADLRYGEACSMDLSSKQTHTALSQGQLEGVRTGLSEQRLYRIEVDGDNLLVQFATLKDILIYDMQTAHITLLPDDIENIRVVGWIDRPTKTPDK